MVSIGRMGAGAAAATLLASFMSLSVSAAPSVAAAGDAKVTAERSRSAAPAAGRASTLDEESALRSVARALPASESRITDYCTSGTTTFENCGKRVTSLSASVCDADGCTPGLASYVGGTWTAGGDPVGRWSSRGAAASTHEAYTSLAPMARCTPSAGTASPADSESRSSCDRACPAVPCAWSERAECRGVAALFVLGAAAWTSNCPSTQRTSHPPG